MTHWLKRMGAWLRNEDNDPVKPPPETTTDTKILFALANGVTLTMMELADQTGIPLDKLGLALDVLRAEGRVACSYSKYFPDVIVYRMTFIDDGTVRSFRDGRGGLDV